MTERRCPVSDVFSTISSLMMVAVMPFYLRQVIQGTSTPNPATWFIWVIMTIMNTFTYYYVVKGDIPKFLITAIVALGVNSIFVYSIFKGKFTKPGKVEIICFMFVFVVGVFWQTTGNDIATNLLLQGIFVISFIPTISGLLKHKAREKPLPWNLATISYAFLALAIISDWGSGGWVALIHPVVIGVLGNGSVGFLAYKQKS